MPTFSFQSLRKNRSTTQIPLTDQNSPRYNTSDETSPIDKSNNDTNNSDDPLDLRDHDVMIQETIKQMSQSRAAKKNLFGLSVTKSDSGSYKVSVLDEVRLGLWLLLIVAIIIVFVFLIVVAVRDDVYLSDTVNHSHGTALIIAGVFCILSCLLSSIQIYQHYHSWTHPESQKLVVRILFMVIIYSITAWMGLMWIEYSVYIDFVRVCYEAFTLYTFMVLLTQYLGGHAGVVEWLFYKEKVKWILPLNCLPRCAPTSNFLWYIKYMCLQYAIVAPVSMLIAVICESLHAYGEGELNTNQGYLYVTIFINTSQIVSLYTLAWLYVIMKKELEPFNPFYKFLVIKAVVFFSFWQGVGLAILVKAGAITDSENFSVGEVQIGLQDFIISIEMFLAAIAHKYTFGAETYKDGSMALLMEQRATFIAQLAYKRAVESARKELEERDRSMELEKQKNFDSDKINKNDLSSPTNKEEIIEARARQILRDQTNASETVLFDNRAINKSSLPASTAEYKHQHRQNSSLIQEAEQRITNEMAEETKQISSHSHTNHSNKQQSEETIEISDDSGYFNDQNQSSDSIKRRRTLFNEISSSIASIYGNAEVKLTQSEKLANLRMLIKELGRYCPAHNLNGVKVKGGLSTLDRSEN